MTQYFTVAGGVIDGVRRDREYAYDRASVRPPPRPRGNLDAQCQLGPLLIFGDRVAFFGAGEAALRRQASCSSGRYFAASSIRRLSSSLVSSVAGLLVTIPRTTILSLGHEAERLEPAGALGVVFHEISHRR